MEKKKTIFDYAAQALMIFGLMVVFLSVCSSLSGDEGRQESTLFSLGAEGMSMASLAQMLGLSALITVIRAVFLSDGLFRNLSMLARTIGMVVCCVAVVVAFIFLFGWFPANDALPWIGFILSFGICFAVSLWIALSRQKRENEAMAEALERLKNE